MSNNHSMPFDNLYLEELGGLLRDNTPSPRLSVYKNNYLSNGGIFILSKHPIL